MTLMQRRRALIGAQNQDDGKIWIFKSGEGAKVALDDFGPNAYVTSDTVVVTITNDYINYTIKPSANDTVKTKTTAAQITGCSGKTLHVIMSSRAKDSRANNTYLYLHIYSSESVIDTSTFPPNAHDTDAYFVNSTKAAKRIPYNNKNVYTEELTVPIESDSVYISFCVYNYHSTWFDYIRVKDAWIE